MSKTLSEYQAHLAKRKELAKEPEKELSAEEKLELKRLQKEAKQAGAILKSDGKGGLPPSLVHTVMRRDKYRCKIHGDHGEGDYGGLEVHHKGGVVESEWLSRKGHKNVPNNLVTLCNKAHNDIHNKAREDGVDSSQVKPEGDDGFGKGGHA